MDEIEEFGLLAIGGFTDAQIDLKVATSTNFRFQGGIGFDPVAMEITAVITHP